MSEDPHLYPGTDVLRNLEGIRDKNKLSAFEADSVAYRTAVLSQNPIEGPFDAERVKGTHRRLFGGVYEWAGRLREGTGKMTRQREPAMW